MLVARRSLPAEALLRYSAAARNGGSSNGYGPAVCTRAWRIALQVPNKTSCSGSFGSGVSARWMSTSKSSGGSSSSGAGAKTSGAPLRGGGDAGGGGGAGGGSGGSGSALGRLLFASALFVAVDMAVYAKVPAVKEAVDERLTGPLPPEVYDIYRRAGVRVSPPPGKGYPTREAWDFPWLRKLGEEAKRLNPFGEEKPGNANDKGKTGLTKKGFSLSTPPMREAVVRPNASPRDNDERRAAAATEAEFGASTVEGDRPAVDDLAAAPFAEAEKATPDELTWATRSAEERARSAAEAAAAAAAGSSGEVSSTSRKLPDNIDAASSRASDAVSDAVSAASGAASDTVSAASDAASDAVSAASDAASDAASSAVSAASDAASGAVSAASDAASGAVRSAREGASAAVGHAKDALFPSSPGKTAADGTDGGDGDSGTGLAGEPAMAGFAAAHDALDRAEEGNEGARAADVDDDLEGKKRRIRDDVLSEVSDGVDAASALVKQDLGQEILNDLKGLDENALRFRVAQLAAELQERTKWEALRLMEGVKQKETEVARKYESLLTEQREVYESETSKALRQQEEELRTSVVKQYGDQLREHMEQQAKEFKEALHANAVAGDEHIRAELAAKHAEEIAAMKEEQLQKNADEIEQLKHLSYKAEKTLWEVESARKAEADEKEASENVHKFTHAALALVERFSTSAPIKTELDSLKQLAPGDELLEAAAGSIPPAAAAKGIPTVPQLKQRFGVVKTECRRASLVPEEAGDGLFGHLLASFLAAVTFAPAGLVEGDAPEDVLARADHHLEAGQLKPAVAELEKLSGLPADVARDWLQDAKIRLTADEALRIIRCHASLLNAKHLGKA